MNTSPTDSGPGSPYQQYSGDSTRPNTTQTTNNLPDIVLGKLMLNIDTIKSDVQEIKINLFHNQGNYIPEIAVGVISSFIVAIIFLMIDSNLSKIENNILGISIPTIVLLFFGMLITWITTYFLTRNSYQKKAKKKNRQK
jgi:hypothetical protein